MTKFLWISREENLKQQWLIKIKCRNIQSIQQARMNHTYYIDLNHGWKKLQFQLALNKTFSLNPQPLTHQRLKQHQRTKINKRMLAVSYLSPHGFSTQSSQYQIWKANKYSILKVNELGLPLLESPARISKLYGHTNSEHKFTKMEIENWLPIGYNLGSSWLGTCSHNGYTMFISSWEELSGFIYPSIKSWNNPENISLSWNYASVLKSYTHQPDYHQSPIKKNPATIIYKHYTH